MNIPLDDWSGAAATKALHDTIKQFVTTSDKQARKMIGLTWAIIVLTIVMLAGLGVQIWLAWNN
jgi:hypothetical protein